MPADGGKTSWPEFATALSRRLSPLATDALCATARRHVGLQDFGDPPVEPALSALVSSLENEANLHPLGRFLMRTHLLSLLETRLRLAESWKTEAGARPTRAVEKPLFIVGMPRSGSTFLHELLSEDPDNRAPRVWEVMFPLAAMDNGPRGREKAIRKAAACLWCFRRLAPRADAVYPMRALTPHECVAIHSYTLLSQEFVSTCHIPGYETFLQNTDLIPAYAWQKRFLQHLQPDGALRRWVLKSPDHVYGLEELFKVFPDAYIVQTHRNPVEVLKSSADLTRVLRGLYGPAGDAEQIAAREARVLAEGTDRFIHFRDSHPQLADRFIDLKYTEVVADPLAAVRRIYTQLDTVLTQAATERMQRLAASRSRYRGRRASAQPARLKLERVLETRFERYCSRFGLPCSEPRPTR